ncbi:hypothetical protein AVEN_260745-1 [Araneus ventricosus]|uniref:Uncharacterized protein n=1 Tax=Araneus ventricosus TaxID=182803 RepID=A0A4Y2LI01_ARAVE|nr:hypothetical protein AVEN_260745-1 [Araneus ventricosus]
MVQQTDTKKTHPMMFNLILRRHINQVIQVIFEQDQATGNGPNPTNDYQLYSVDNFRPNPCTSNNQNPQISSNISHQELSNIVHSYSSNTLLIDPTNISQSSPSRLIKSTCPTFLNQAHRIFKLPKKQKSKNTKSLKCSKKFSQVLKIIIRMGRSRTNNCS